MTLTVNAERFQHDFDALSQIGATGDGGVNRPCWSAAHLETQSWWLARAAEASLEVRRDSAGNCSAILRSETPEAKTLLLGSHTDSVPNGGRFDGALGVLAALEAARSIKDADLHLPVNVEVMDFADEEGTLVGILGSQAVAGTLTAEALKNPRGGRAALEEGLTRANLTEAGLLAAGREPSFLAGYLELHIEQGPNLTRNAVAIGVVQGIVGIRSFRIIFRGQANHAGTTPMDQRADASLGAAAFTLTAREMVLREFVGCTANIGQITLAPGAYNIVPGTAELALEFRAPDLETLNNLEAALMGLARVSAHQFGLEVSTRFVGGCAPAPMHATAKEALTLAADSLALSYVPMFSGAGHDAMSLAHLMPCGMVFIPSRDGISHSPLEFSSWDDCVNGANVLLRAAILMSRIP